MLQAFEVIGGGCRRRGTISELNQLQRAIVQGGARETG